MKNTLAFLIATIATVSVFAGETVCLNATLSVNTQPELSCGEVKTACVKGFEQNDNARESEKLKATSLLLTNDKGESLEMGNPGSTVSHDSDIDTHLGLEFSGKKISAYMEIETADMDYDAHGEIIGTFISLDLYRGYKVGEEIKVQRCEYKLSK